MAFSVIYFWLLLVSACSANQFQQYFLPASLSIPERFPELGLTPRYHALVFDYISRMAGSQPPAHVRLAVPARFEEFETKDEPALVDAGAREPVTEGSPLQPSHLLPSDFILLTRSPQSQFFGNFDVKNVQNKKMKLGVEGSALPPVGGVVSNYILQRKVNDKVKRQAYYYNDVDNQEGVVINASEQKAEEGSTKSNSTATATDEAKEEPQPSVAQSKPQAIAVAGPGGVAQAAPVATAVVGKDGLAIAAPSATAIAGKQTGQVQFGGEEKLRRLAASAIKTTENKE